MAGGGGGTTTSTSKVDTGPWSDQAPYLRDVMQSAALQYKNHGNLQYYPDSTVSPFTAGQTQGYQSIVDKGLAGSPFMDASGRNATDTLNGKYLDPSSNPWLTGTFDAAADAVTRQFKTATAPTTDAMFSGNGSYNSSARYNSQNNNNMGLGSTLGNLANSIYGGNYANERQNQLAMQGMVPSLASARYIDPMAAAGAGAAQQQQNQSVLSDQVNRFNFDQQSPWQTLGLYKQLVDGQYGQSGSTTTTQPSNSSGLGSAIGGGLGLLGTIGGAYFGGPFGASLGGSLGRGIGSGMTF